MGSGWPRPSRTDSVGGRGGAQGNPSVHHLNHVLRLHRLGPARIPPPHPPSRYNRYLPSLYTSPSANTSPTPPSRCCPTGVRPTVPTAPPPAPHRRDVVPQVCGPQCPQLPLKHRPCLVGVRQNTPVSRGGGGGRAVGGMQHNISITPSVAHKLIPQPFPGYKARARPPPFGC